MFRVFVCGCVLCAVLLVCFVCLFVRSWCCVVLLVMVFSHVVFLCWFVCCFLCLFVFCVSRFVLCCLLSCLFVCLCFLGDGGVFVVCACFVYLL